LTAAQYFLVYTPFSKARSRATKHQAQTASSALAGSVKINQERFDSLQTRIDASAGGRFIPDIMRPVTHSQHAIQHQFGQLFGCGFQINGAPGEQQR
jgi:hypothetical protein